MGRYLGLDIGDKTIGVAVSDPLFLTAQGVCTIERVGVRKDTGKVIEYVDEYDATVIVAGLPLNLSGEDSIQTQKVREFVAMLENKLRSTGHSKVEVVFQDERFTTKISEAVLMEAGVRRENRKQYLDKMAAQLILQTYMDSHPQNK